MDNLIDKYLGEATKKIGKVGKNLSGVKGVSVTTKRGGAPYTFLTTKKLNTDDEVMAFIKAKLAKVGDKTEITSVKGW